MLPATKDCGLSFAVDDVSKTFKRVNPCKAAGPDRVLRPAGYSISLYLSQFAVPICFKIATNVPVPKKALN
jgi:hypothetical protein